MTNPIIQINNIETGEIIEREMNVEEYRVYLAVQQAEEIKAQAEAEAAEKKAAAEAKLATLGLTKDDFKALALG